MWPRSSPGRWLIPGVVCGLAVVIVGWLSGMFHAAPFVASRLDDARDLLALGEWSQAEEFALSVAREGDDRWAWIVAGEAAARSASPENAASLPSTTSSSALKRAANWYRTAREGVPRSPESESLWQASTSGAAEVLIALKRLSAAEAELVEAARVGPVRPDVARRLADLANFSGRRDVAVPYLRHLLPSPRTTLDDLFHLGDVDHPLDLTPDLVQQAERPEADPLVVMAAAAFALADNRPHDAIHLYERVITARPEDPSAWGGLGRALFESAPEQLAGWKARLPEPWRTSATVAIPPPLLQPLSRMAEQQNDLALAVGLAAAEVHARPESRVAWHRFARLLARTGHADAAASADKRAAALLRLSLWLDDLFKHRTHADLLRRVTDQLVALGRHAEATAWARYSLSVLPAADWAGEIVRSPRSDVPADPLAEVVARFIPQPTPSATVTRDGRPARDDRPFPSAYETAPSPAVSLRFDDVANKMGLEYVHRSARDPRSPGARIIETTGGGVAVLDYDLDRFPDLYLTQGADQPPDPANGFQLSGSAAKDRDALFRNVGGERYQQVTGPAGLVDREFGQGAAAGDFDSDGFPDLYVANLGPNRLHLNLGDGTFLDATPEEIRTAPVWTSSCLIADLTGDGHPDLFDATYCAGTDILTRMCNEQGTVRSCSPRAFAAERDRLWINSANGEWQAAPEGLDLVDGFGLGVVAFRPAVDMPLSVFVANDETPNYWLVNKAAGGQPPVWKEEATAAGLAVDADGRPQACMGVACDDLDGDGLVDLFVTNFHHESNTFYRALSPLLYVDDTRPAQLRQPSWNMLGFGTQSLDADADGAPDLLVANGHIDDLTERGEPFEMPLQLFHNRRGSFREVPASEAGPAFSRLALGRGVARLDWNGDGLDDAAVVNQQSPLVLLENRTEGAGARLALTLTGTRSCRDPVGAIVVASFGGRQLTRQLTAGDGYQASNERRLLFGFGDYVGSVTLEIHWPDGVTESHSFNFSGPGRAHFLHVVEGRRPK